MKTVINSIYFILLLFVIGCLSTSTEDSQLNLQYKIAFMPDVHFHDVFATFDDTEFTGLPTEYLGHSNNASIRTMQAQLTSTRLFNENYFAFIAALEDAIDRGIKIIALPGDFSDDGQPIHIKGLVEILNRYQKEHDLMFFIAPGNHDPNRPFNTEAGKYDYLGKEGKQQPVFSSNHPMCNQNSASSLSHKSNIPLHPIACTDQVIELGYSGLFTLLEPFGLQNSSNYIYYETPFSRGNSTNPNIFEIENRQYEICKEGSGGLYKKAEFTLCTSITDMSYLVEPIEGLWLLSIDANVYIPTSYKDSGEIRFSGSGNAGYRKVITHKKHIIEWMTDVAARARQNNKTLITFSHFPAADFYNGAKPLIEDLWGENQFQLSRLPPDSVSTVVAKTGIGLHIAGHMHMNDTALHLSPHSGDGFINIQVPSIAAYVPAYKIIRTQHNSHIFDVETVILDEVPGFDTFFTHYQSEWNQLNSIDFENIWDKDILTSKSYSEFAEWHIKELSRLRFLPNEWPDEIRVFLSRLSGRDMLILSQLESLYTLTDFIDSGISGLQELKSYSNHQNDWLIATKKAENITIEAGLTLNDFSEWNGSDLSTDFYRLRNAGKLSFKDIPKNRIKQYSLLSKSLSYNSIITTDHSGNYIQLDAAFRKNFHIVFQVMELFKNRTPNQNFIIDLDSMVITTKK